MLAVFYVYSSPDIHIPTFDYDGMPCIKRWAPISHWPLNAGSAKER